MGSALRFKGTQLCIKATGRFPWNISIQSSKKSIAARCPWVGDGHSPGHIPSHGPSTLPHRGKPMAGLPHPSPSKAGHQPPSTITSLRYSRHCLLEFSTTLSDAGFNFQAVLGTARSWSQWSLGSLIPSRPGIACDPTDLPAAETPCKQHCWFWS